ncbi:hypothetical protein Tco_1477066 [Tanacetum coccineum]
MVKSDGYDEDIHDLISVEAEFPAIAFNDGVSSKKTLSCKPTVSSLNDEIDFKISFDDLTMKITRGQDMALPPRDQRHQYLRYEGLQYSDVDIADFEERLERIHDRGEPRDVWAEAVHCCFWDCIRRRKMAPQQPPQPTSCTVGLCLCDWGDLRGGSGGYDGCPQDLRGLVQRSMTDQGIFSTWMISCMTQLMEASGQTYQAFDGTFQGSSPAAFQRCTRQRTGGASTSTA